MLRTRGQGWRKRRRTGEGRGKWRGREAFPFPCPNLCRLNERIGAPALHLLETRIKPEPTSNQPRLSPIHRTGQELFQ